MILLFLPAAFALPPGATCETLARLGAHAGPLHPPALPPPGGGERDAYELPEEATSPHFALRWGGALDVDAETAEAVLDALEAAWGVAVDEMDHPAPEGSDAYLFNVYVGNSGDGAPAIGSATAGYFTADQEGWPMIVLHPDILADLVYTRSVAAHELYHAVQHATGSYPDYSLDSESAWFWEATAVWMEDEVFPEDPYYPEQLVAFAYYPHLPLSYFGDPGTGQLAAFHQYGAFIFPRYLSEQVADWRMIRDAWVEGGGYDDPLDRISEDLAAMDLDLGAVAAEFAARNAVWDYADGELYEDWLDYVEGWYDDQDHRIADRVAEGGTGGWAEPPAETLPQRLGANVLRLDSPACGELTIQFEGENTGEQGTPAAWYALAVVDEAGGPRYEPIAWDEREGGITLVISGAERAVDLVVAPHADERARGEVFPYRYAMSLDPGGDCAGVSAPTPPSAGGTRGFSGDDARRCGCGDEPSSGWALLLPLLWLSRRQRIREG